MEQYKSAEQAPQDNFERQWENPKHIKVIGSGKYGLVGEFFDVYDIKSQNPKTPVPLAIGMGWGADPVSDKEHIKYWTEHGRRVVIPDTPHGISAEKKENLPAIEIEKMTALYETLRASGIYIKEDGMATGKVDLMGRSEGAIFSILLAYFFPQLVRNLVLENPAGLTGKINKGIFFMRWARQMKQDIRKEYKEAGTQPKDRLPEVLGRNLPKAIESILAISEADVQEMLKEIRANGIGVSVITTDQDRFFPPEKLVDESKVDKFSKVEGTHNSYFWEPERFAGLVDKDLDELEAKKKTA